MEMKRIKTKENEKNKFISDTDGHKSKNTIPIKMVTSRKTAKLLCVLISLFLGVEILFCFVVVKSEEETDEAILEWEKYYGDHRMWDYQINASFAAQNMERYAWNPSMRPVLPDEKAISPTEAHEFAYHLIPQYGCGLTAEFLKSLTCVVSSYIKPEDNCDNYLSGDGTWIIDFWDTAPIYLHAVTGFPLALVLDSGSHYIGGPENFMKIAETEG